MNRLDFYKLFLLGAVACGHNEPATAPPGASSKAAELPASSPPNAAVASAPPSTTADPPPAVAAIRLFDAPEEGDLFATIRAARLRASESDRVLVVYVGASWCPPCKRFHDAIKSHSLDDKLAGFDFLYLDMDVVKDKIVETGYASKYIPFFALPKADGKRGEAFEIKRTDAKAQDELLEKLAAWRPKPHPAH